MLRLFILCLGHRVVFANREQVHEEKRFASRTQLMLCHVELCMGYFGADIIE
jgi:hypothetical protein